MTGEQLERESYDSHNTTATCEQCGTSIDVEDESYGVSMDGESYCCDVCMDSAVKISARGGTGLSGDRFSSDASLNEVEITVWNRPNRQVALKSAFDLAEVLFEGAPAYIREG